MTLATNVLLGWFGLSVPASVLIGMALRRRTSLAVVVVDDRQRRREALMGPGSVLR